MIMLVNVYFFYKVYTWFIYLWKIMSVILISSNSNHETEFTNMIKEYIDVDGKVMPGTMRLNDWENFKDFLIRQYNSKIGINVPVPGTLYFIVHKNTERILWWIQIRHFLNGSLRVFWWHISYWIRPSERGKWYATLALNLAIPIARELGIKDIMLTCDKNNIWSAKTIQNNWWELEAEYIYNWVMIQKRRIKK